MRDMFFPLRMHARGMKEKKERNIARKKKGKKRERKKEKERKKKRSQKWKTKLDSSVGKNQFEKHRKERRSKHIFLSTKS